MVIRLSTVADARASSAMHRNVMPFATRTWNRCRSCAYDTRLRFCAIARQHIVQTIAKTVSPRG